MLIVAQVLHQCRFWLGRSSRTQGNKNYSGGPKRQRWSLFVGYSKPMSDIRDHNNSDLTNLPVGKH